MRSWVRTPFRSSLNPGLNFTKDEFVTYLERQGVDSRNLFYSIPTQTESYQFMGHKMGDFPNRNIVPTMARISAAIRMWISLKWIMW